MKHEPELDRNYTPEDVSGVKVSSRVIFAIILIAALLVMAIFIAIDKSREAKNRPVYIHDTETVSTVERLPLQKPGYVTLTGIVRDFDLDTTRFKPGSKIYSYDGVWVTEGDILTSGENGALILWDTTMPESWIIGVVSDSGLIDFKPLK